MAAMIAAIGQTTKKPVGLPPAINGIHRESLTFAMSVLTRGSSDDLDEIKDDILSRLSSPKSPQLIRKNKTVLTNYVNDMGRFGESLNSLFNYTEDSLPFDFYSFNNLKVFMQSGVIANFELNTLKLDAQERASSVAKEVLLPGLSNFAPLMTSADINYFGIVCGFVVRDFSKDENSVAYKDGETVAIIVPKSVVKRYLASEITDEEVIKLSSFYNSNKTTRGVKKILVK